MNRVLTIQIWNKRLRPADKLVALALAQLCRPDSDRCHASLRYLAAMTRYNPNTVHASIRSLEDQGVISRYQAHRRAQTEYTLHPTR